MCRAGDCADIGGVVSYLTKDCKNDARHFLVNEFELIRSGAKQILIYYLCMRVFSWENSAWGLLAVLFEEFF
jgi:hypothetical protein